MARKQSCRFRHRAISAVARRVLNNILFGAAGSQFMVETENTSTRQRREMTTLLIKTKVGRFVNIEVRRLLRLKIVLL